MPSGDFRQGCPNCNCHPCRPQTYFQLSLNPDHPRHILYSEVFPETPPQSPEDAPRSFYLSKEDIEVLNEALRALHAETYRQELADKAYLLRKRFLEF